MKLVFFHESCIRRISRGKQSIPHCVVRSHRFDASIETGNTESKPEESRSFTIYACFLVWIVLLDDSTV